MCCKPMTGARALRSIEITRIAIDHIRAQSLLEFALHKMLVLSESGGGLANSDQAARLHRSQLASMVDHGRGDAGARASSSRSQS